MTELVSRKEFDQAMYQAGLKKVCRTCGKPEWEDDGSYVRHPNTCTYTGFADEDWKWVKR